jgi:hypothetical protein
LPMSQSHLGRRSQRSNKRLKLAARVD